MAQARNPFTPERVYIPDGEAHVFDDRVYLYGSHDKEGGKSYCRLGYEVFSAPIDNLSQWTSKGINYQARQDPLSEKTDRPYRYAPDCVKGNDGRYYLYYCLAGEKGKGREEGKEGRRKGRKGGIAGGRKRSGRGATREIGGR